MKDTFIKIRKYIVTAFIIIIMLVMSLLTFYKPHSKPNPPVFNGLDNDIYLELGITFSLMDYVQAVDSDGNDITSNVKTQGTVDVFTLGSYSVTYRVTDKLGRETIKTVMYNVIDTMIPRITMVSPVGAIIKGNGYDVKDFVEKVVDNLGLMDLEKLVGMSVVDPEIEGEYAIEYMFTDDGGNVANESYPVIVGTLRELIDTPITDDQVAIKRIQEIIISRNKNYTLDQSLLTNYVYVEDASEEAIQTLMDRLDEYTHFCVMNNSNTFTPTIFIYYGN